MLNLTLCYIVRKILNVLPQNMIFLLKIKDHTKICRRKLVSTARSCIIFFADDISLLFQGCRTLSSSTLHQRHMLNPQMKVVKHPK